MAFIPTNPIIGAKVKLVHDVRVMKGVFTKGHVMKITGFAERGYDLADVDGNTLLECPRDNFEVIG
jgi:hypothetical protein